MKMKAGFTLVELSIVLVIIGLITGGVLVGRDLIDAAAIRAQISQIEKYQATVNTFRGKYGYLPGDIPDPTASQYGFGARGGFRGQGDGNGLLEGFLNYTTDLNNGMMANGENLQFWEDLNKASLIEGGFSNFAWTTTTPIWSPPTSTPLATYLPDARIGGRNSIYVFSAGHYTSSPPDPWEPAGMNYFGLGSISSLAWLYGVNPGITVQQAYSIDNKTDDGLPQTGRVVAVFVGFDDARWVTPDGTTTATASGSGFVPVTTATPGSAATCFDNGGVAGPQNYSLGQNNGAGLNCALSFRFQ
jgi:prepilin-type N-terminal cleavage/methylation domain-containing protein